MKISYTIEVDCASCANLIENAINKLDGVESASLNFMLQRAVIEFSDAANISKTKKEILKTGRKVDPDFEIY